MSRTSNPQFVSKSLGEKDFSSRHDQSETKLLHTNHRPHGTGIPVFSCERYTDWTSGAIPKGRMRATGHKGQIRETGKDVIPPSSCSGRGGSKQERVKDKLQRAKEVPLGRGFSSLLSIPQIPYGSLAPGDSLGPTRASPLPPFTGYSKKSQ